MRVGAEAGHPQAWIDEATWQISPYLRDVLVSQDVGKRGPATMRGSDLCTVGLKTSIRKIQVFWRNLWGRAQAHEFSSRWQSGSRLGKKM